MIPPEQGEETMPPVNAKVRLPRQRKERRKLHVEHLQVELLAFAHLSRGSEPVACPGGIGEGSDDLGAGLIFSDEGVPAFMVVPGINYRGD
ncbi:hypothetical protein [Methanocalculus natronophilus]|uniref:hypothetical protein n=1 Tax=Methanocalculus natronophilus TaxID=1262400 RepID=UPI0031B5F057